MPMSTLLPIQPEWLPMSLVPGKKLTDAEFERLCFSSDLIQFERTRDGEILLNAPAGGGTSSGNAEIIVQLRVWWKTHRTQDVSSARMVASFCRTDPCSARMRLT